MTEAVKAPSLRVGLKPGRRASCGLDGAGGRCHRTATVLCKAKVDACHLGHHHLCPDRRFEGWARANRRTHLLFTGFFQPITSAVDWAITGIEEALLWVPWFVLPIASLL